MRSGVRGQLPLGLVIVMAAATFFAAARQPPPSSGDTASRRPARIDVVAIDRREHAVLGLQASDFEVLQDGTPRPIVSVEFHRRGGSDPPAAETDQDAARAARQPGTRVFAFFLDELHVSRANADLVRKTVAAFIDEKLEARDLVGVMKPFDAAESVRFTRDRAFAHGVIASFEGRKEDDRARTPQEAQALAAPATGPGGVRAQMVKAGLRELGLRLGELNAERPVLVLFSEGFPADAATADVPLPDVAGLLRVASRHHITIFTFNPAPPVTGAVPAAADEPGRDTLQWLAAQTGGLAIAGDRFIYGVARLFHDTEAYYAVTYQAGEPDGRFHRLDVRAKRSGTVVLTQRGYWALRESDWSAVLSLPGNGVPATDRSLRRSPLVDTWVGLERGRSGATFLLLTCEPRPGRGRSVQRAVVRARAIDGKPLFDSHLAPIGRASADTRDLARFAAPPGRIELDLTILGPQGQVLDTDVRNFDVPTLRGGAADAPTLLPAWIVRAATPRALPLSPGELQIPPAALRTFHRSQYLIIRVPVFDPTGEGVRVTATLLNQSGRLMRSLDAVGDEREDGSDFALPLAVLAAGEYQLELRAENQHGAATDRVTIRVAG